MNREGIWTISKTISSREPRLPGPKVGDTEFFKTAWKSFFNSFQIIWETFHFFHPEKYSGTCEIFLPAIWNYLKLYGTTFVQSISDQVGVVGFTNQ